MSKQNIFFFVILVVAIEGVILSLKHTSTHVTDEAEIKHFDIPKIEEAIRLKGGLTIEDYIEKHIKVVNAIRRYRGPIITYPDTKADTKDTVEPKAAKPKPKYTPGIMLLYKVRPGDTLSHLAREYKTTVYQIRKLNKMAPDAVLQSGKRLMIVPEQKPTYRVEKDETLKGIASKFEIDINKLLELNNFSIDQELWSGQRILMPISQRSVDEMVAALAKIAQQTAERKKQYRRRLITRIIQLRKEREAKRKEEELKRKLAEQRKAMELKRQQELKRKKELARLAKARKALRYTPGSHFKHKMWVTATAYTSHSDQTDRTPFLAAWNNRIRPGMKIIAVSDDLIRHYGITNGVQVKIGGLPGIYVVRDKMNKKWRKRIDIYMGMDRRRTLRWGRRRVLIYY